MTDKPDTSREDALNALIDLEALIAHRSGVMPFIPPRKHQGPLLEHVAVQFRALLDKCDAAIARAEKAEAALEAARIEGCRMGLMCAKNIAVDAIHKNNDAADQIADRIYTLNPARIVKERGK